MRAAFASFLLFFLAACDAGSGPLAEPMVAPILTGEEARDEMSHAQPEVARVTHVALDLALDFEAKDVSGTATLDILAEPGADTIILGRAVWSAEDPSAQLERLVKIANRGRQQ